MSKIKQLIKNSFLTITIMLLSGLTPIATLAVHAEETPNDTSTSETTPATTQSTEPDTSPTETAPVAVTTTAESEATTTPSQPQQGASSTGPQTPNGAAANTYTYNESTKKWENDHYTWDPVTKQTKPKTQPTYSYNPDTGMWDTEEWRYNPASGKYEPNVISSAAPPSGATSQQIAQARSQAAGSNADSSAISNQGPGANGEISSNNATDASFDLFYNANISNRIDSNAQSGDASVLSNTFGGDALTGDARSIANVFNLLQSYWGLGSANLMTFMYDIFGNVVGDLFIDPAQITNTGPGSTSSIEENNETSIDINAEQNGQINNDIKLSAQSGDATVQGNTEAGNATSGSAHAIANVVNMLNSAISAGSSFMGILNIYGNLEGDILLPEGLLSTLLANSGPNSSSTISENNQTDIDANITNNQAINNTVNATAATGQATVNQNTSAGNATTGDALTNLNILNLTGRQIVGSNSLLVFVNVLGQWTGLIMDAPSGTTSAALGGGISQDIQRDTTTNVDLDVTNNNQINNNIDVNAQSGDATVEQNTDAGDATTGNATASVNVANIMDSQLNLSDFFGIMFINVLGTWNGSFGVDTEMGNRPVPATAANTGGQEQAEVFSFVPSDAPSTSAQKASTRSTVAFASTNQPASVEIEENNEDQEAVLAAASDTSSSNPSGGTTDETASSTNPWALPSLGFVVATSLLGAERVMTIKGRRKHLA